MSSDGQPHAGRIPHQTSSFCHWSFSDTQFYCCIDYWPKENKTQIIIAMKPLKLVLSWILQIVQNLGCMQKLTSSFDLKPPIPNLVALGLVQTYIDQPYLSMLRPTNIQSTLPLIGDLQRFLTVFPNHGPPLCKGSEQMIAKTITNTDILFGSFPMTCKHGDTNPQYKTTETHR